MADYDLVLLRLYYGMYQPQTERVYIAQLLAWSDLIVSLFLSVLVNSFSTANAPGRNTDQYLFINFRYHLCTAITFNLPEAFSCLFTQLLASKFQQRRRVYNE